MRATGARQRNPTAVEALSQLSYESRTRGLVTSFYLLVAIFLLLNVVGGMVRILLGPTRGDRMLAAQLFGTTGVAVVLLLAEALDRPALRDVAFILVLLAVINTVVFVRYSRQAPGARHQERSS
jgi:multicomponent Na+:H+ antiporter subunit F